MKNNPETHQYLFSYGTLQRADVQIRLFGRLLKGTKSVLQNYKIVASEITDKRFLAAGEEKIQKNLLRSEGDAVAGMIFQVTDQELIIADKYEPSNYRRVTAAVQSGEKVWIYVADSEKQKSRK